MFMLPRYNYGSPLCVHVNLFDSRILKPDKSSSSHVVKQTLNNKTNTRINTKNNIKISIMKIIIIIIINNNTIDFCPND